MIGTAESIIIILTAAIGDAVEIAGALLAVVPVLGIAIWLFCLFLGFIVSAILLMWSFLRGGGGHGASKVLMKRVLIMLASWLIDELTGGPLPMKTIGVILTILVNNHYAKKDAREEDGGSKKEQTRKATSLTRAARTAKTAWKYGKYLLEI